jgi:hypothetical protein
MTKLRTLTTGAIATIPIAITLAVSDPSTANIPYPSRLVAKSLAPKIGIIKNTQLLNIRGTFCDLHRLTDKANTNRDVFLSVYEGNLKSKAIMNIDGQDIILSSVKETKNKRGSNVVYRAKNLLVKVNYTRTSPEMEGASYDATIIVTRGKNQTTLKTAGACGI